MQNIAFRIQFAVVLLMASVLTQACGNTQTSRAQPRQSQASQAQAPLQRQSGPEMLGHATESMTAELVSDYGDPNNGASGGINLFRKSKLVPDRSYKTIWVHIFPIFKMQHGSLEFPKAMGVADPYHQTKDLSSISLHNDNGFKIAKLSDGAIVGTAKDISFSLTQNTMSFDSVTTTLEDIYVEPAKDPNNEGVSDARWDKTHLYHFHGGFVVTRDTSPFDKPCLRVVNVVNFETYVADVTPGEMPKEYPFEALKVQAVAARTYALNRMLGNRKNGYAFDIFPNTQDQLYLGTAKEDERTTDATQATASIVMTYRGEVIQAMFHANSGGRTCSYADCYGPGGVPYLKSVEEPDPQALRRGPGGRNVASVPVHEFVNALKEKGINIEASDDLRFMPSEVNASERIVEARVEGSNGSARIPFEVIRGLRDTFGISSWYIGQSEAHDGNIELISYGWGHGVGLSQEGARLQAANRKSFEKILKFYYVGAQLTDLSKLSP